jgi:putative endonuclease
MTEEVSTYYFYVLLCADGTFYGGYSPDVHARVAAHNAGQGAKYTKSRLPVMLLYYEQFDNKHDALSAEWHFKHQPRAQKEEFLRAHGIAW